MKVYIVFDLWDEYYDYDDYEDYAIQTEDLVDVFSSREKAIECIKELIAKHNVETLGDHNLDIDGEIYGRNPEDGELHNYYILERLVR